MGECESKKVRERERERERVRESKREGVYACVPIVLQVYLVQPMQGSSIIILGLQKPVKISDNVETW